MVVVQMHILGLSKKVAFGQTTVQFDAEMANDTIDIYMNSDVEDTSANLTPMYIYMSTYVLLQKCCSEMQLLVLEIQSVFQSSAFDYRMIRQ